MFSSHFNLSKVFKVFGWLIIVCVPIAAFVYMSLTGYEVEVDPIYDWQIELSDVITPTKTVYNWGSAIITSVSGIFGGMLFLAVGAFLEWQGIVGTAFIDTSKLVLSKTYNINNVEFNDEGKVYINPDKYCKEDLLNILKQQNGIKVKEVYVDEEGNFIDNP